LLILSAGPPRSPVKWWPSLDKKALSVTLHTLCGNCGATLMGPYCSNCGQHAHESARSISALSHDAWHIATHVDSRFWQTLYILLLKPGKLTREYFAEKRARYLPPVRVYLVLSVLFFAFGLATPHQLLVLSHNGAEVVANPAAKADSGDENDQDAGGKKSTGFTFNARSCDKIETSFPGLKDALRQSCLRNIENNGQMIKRAFVANIPKMMFVFVPMMALVMLLLYWRPRRYYVEHLVFFLHNHAAVFLLLLIQAALGWLAAWLGWSTFDGWVIALVSIYTVWYVYRAMRVYYGQGRVLTLAKLCAVGFTYMIGFSITLFVTFLFSAIIT
jgi:hypothetical protein